MQSAEISYRRYWLGYVPRISGTLLAGFRYTRLDDDFSSKRKARNQPLNFPFGPLAALDTKKNAKTTSPASKSAAISGSACVKACGSARKPKFGYLQQPLLLTNEITTTPFGTTPPTLFEEFEGRQAAFIGEGSVDLVADILPSVSLRVGYEVLFMNSLVLAGENFNADFALWQPGPA